MPDESNPTPAPTLEPVAATPQAPASNTPESRNPDGSLKNLLEAKPEPTSKPDGEPEPKAGEPKPEEPKGTPAYEPFKAPEGYELDATLVEKFSPLAKELGLDQAGAQRLVDFYGEAALAAAEAPHQAFETMQADWRKDVIASKDLGNGKDGLKPEVAARINSAIDSLPEAIRQPFKEAMTLTGAGNNLAFIRAFDALAQKLPREGSLVSGKGPSAGGQTAPGAGPKSMAQAIFPNLNSAR